MIYDYAFQPAQRVLTGPGAVKSVSSRLEKLGKTRAVIFTGNSLATKTNLVGDLESLLGAYHAGTFAGCKQHVLSGSVDEATAYARVLAPLFGRLRASGRTINVGKDSDSLPNPYESQLPNEGKPLDWKPEFWRKLAGE